MTVGEAAVGTFHNIQVPVPTFTDTDTGTYSISATERIRGSIPMTTSPQVFCFSVFEVTFTSFFKDKKS